MQGQLAEQLNESLISAVKSLNISEVRKAISLGADANTRDSSGNPVLVLAAGRGAPPEIIQALVKSGADVNIRAKHGYTPLLALSSFSPGYFDAMKYLVENGADVNAANDNGKTALMILAGQTADRFGIDKACKYLISVGADVNMADNKGNRAIFYASAGDGADFLCPLFIKAGADINYKNNVGKTLLSMIADSFSYLCRSEAFQAIVEAGADIHAEDDDGKGLLTISIINHFYPGLELLVRSGADVNRADGTGHVPLHYAIAKGNLNMLWILLHGGVDVQKNEQEWESLLDTFAYHNPLNPASSIRIFSYLAFKNLDFFVSHTSLNSVAEKLSSGKSSKVEYRGAIALVAATIFYPEQCDELDRLISKRRSEAVALFLRECPFNAPGLPYISPENFIGVLERGKNRGYIQLDSKDEKEQLVSMILNVFETNPLLACRFVRKRIGGQLEVWNKESVRGVESLVSKVSLFLSQLQKEKTAVSKYNRHLEKSADVVFF